MGPLSWSILLVHEPFYHSADAVDTRDRCKLICLSLHGLVTKTSSKSHGVFTPAWFAFHRGRVA